MQCWERVIPYQSEDPSPTIPTLRMKEEYGKTVGGRMEASSQANKKILAILLKPASPTPSNTGSQRSFNRDTNEVLRGFCCEEAHKCTHVSPN